MICPISRLLAFMARLHDTGKESASVIWEDRSMRWLGSTILAYNSVRECQVKMLWVTRIELERH